MNDIYSELTKKLASKNATIAIIGLGYVGLPLMLSFAESGYKVIGYDIDDSKIKNLSENKSYIKHISSSRIKNIEKKAHYTSDTHILSTADALMICVPTPLGEHLDPDLSYIHSTLKSLIPHLRKGQVLSLESTTYPGTTEEVVCPYVEKLGLNIGKDFFVVYSPEREDPGNINYNTQTIPKVCGGITSQCLTVGQALYEQVIDQVVPVTSAKVAEMTKLLENIHRAVNIGLVNELKVVCDYIGVDIFEVIHAAKTKPFGFVPYYPGPGLGGHCIPIDPFYLTWKAKEFGLHTRFIELAGEINSGMPMWVFEKITRALNQAKKSVNGSNLLVLGIAYKKNIEDLRESPAVDLIEILTSNGATVEYSDPLVPAFPKTRGHRFEKTSVTLSPESLKRFDAVVLATDHDDFDYDMIYEFSNIIIDTRGRYSTKSAKIVRA